jgi:lysophospholipase L1-like esterase
MCWNRIGVAAAVVLLAGCASEPSDQDRASDTSSSTPSATPSTTESASEDTLSFVVIGDSIPFNSAEDCSGCTGFVDRYADALSEATGEPVTTQNASQHTGLTLPQLWDQLDAYEDDLRGADAILVAIAHNSFPLSEEKPCGSTFDEVASTIADWSMVDAACARAAATRYEPVYDKLFSTVATWREGEPTILLTIDKYNDWNGWKPAHLTPEQVEKTVLLHRVWNDMLCEAASRNGFACVQVSRAFNGPDGTRPSGPLLAADHTHPSQRGNAVIAELLVAEGFRPLA